MERTTKMLLYLILIISILLLIISAWALHNFRKISERMNQVGDDVVRNQCNVDPESIRGGKTFAIITLVVSIFSMLVVGVIIWKSSTEPTVEKLEKLKQEAEKREQLVQTRKAESAYRERISKASQEYKELSSGRSSKPAAVIETKSQTPTISTTFDIAKLYGTSPKTSPVV